MRIYGNGLTDEAAKESIKKEHETKIGFPRFYIKGKLKKEAVDKWQDLWNDMIHENDEHISY